jgi:RNA polymerase sigma-70 factor (ECF subfamily)
MTLLAERPTFRAVFDDHVGYVWRVLRHLGVRERDLDDAVQEVFVVVHRRLPEWEPRAPIRTWLYVICVHAARDHARRAHVRRELPSESVPDVKDDGKAPDDALEAREALFRVERAVTALDERLRQVFLLYELEGWTMETIAETLEIPLKTAYSRLRLAREKLRVSLAREVDRARG